jgi:hypothetical protein
MSRPIKTPCRGRKLTKCKRAVKSCSYARGTQRRYCRKRRNGTRKNISK